MDQTAVTSRLRPICHGIALVAPVRGCIQEPGGQGGSGTGPYTQQQRLDQEAETTMNAAHILKFCETLL